jgi:1-pyrroline-5-carboxylate dehydrogenase
MVPEFRNEPLTDFSVAANRSAFEAALGRVADEANREFPLIIGGQPVTTGRWIASTNPAEKGQIVGRVASAGPSEADRALAAAERAFAEWSRFPASERARVLLRVAAELRRRKHEFSATMVLEVGKTWVEADADTAEAIDFCEFYARDMLRLGGSQPVTTLAGNDTELLYVPLGVGLAIPPWNFPTAIACGLCVSAAVCGNTVIFKPASITPIVAARLMDVFATAGLPAGVVNFLPGPGDTVGDYLVSHPRVRFISFTGSKDVGIRIWERAAQVQPGQRWLKRVVAEMGGKDTIVVDESADLDLAAREVVTAAYGFQGQKCSACSRLVAVDSVYEPLIQKVVERASQLRVGNPRDLATQVGPVASAQQFAKVTEYLQIGKDEAELLLGGTSDDQTGYFVQPTVFGNAKPTARIATEEIFGPVLTCLRAPDFDEALQIANSTEYGLTGSVFARDAAKLARARQEFHVGNLYLNRKCTGALVGVEPFGGFNLSGTDAKAGGRDHLLQFLQGKSVSERL